MLPSMRKVLLFELLKINMLYSHLNVAKESPLHTHSQAFSEYLFNILFPIKLFAKNVRETWSK